MKTTKLGALGSKFPIWQLGKKTWNSVSLGTALIPFHMTEADDRETKQPWCRTLALQPVHVNGFLRRTPHLCHRHAGKVKALHLKRAPTTAGSARVHKGIAISPYDTRNRRCDIKAEKTSTKPFSPVAAQRERTGMALVGPWATGQAYWPDQSLVIHDEGYIVHLPRCCSLPPGPAFGIGAASKIQRAECATQLEGRL